MWSRKVSWFCVLMVLSCPRFALAAGAAAESIPIDIFAEVRADARVYLSPNGMHVAVQQFGHAGPRITIFEIEDQALVKSGEQEFPSSLVHDLAWADSDRLLVSVTVVPVEVTADSVLEHRLVAIGTGGGQSETILSFEVNRLIGNDPSSILRVVGPGQILIAIQADKGFFPEVYLLDLVAGTRTLVEPVQKGVTNWYADLSGVIRLGQGVGKDDEPIVLYRAADSPEWLDVSDNKVLASGWFQPITFDRSGEHLFLKSAFGNARQSIYKLDLNRMRIVRKVYQHPLFDVGSVFLSSTGEDVAGVSYIGDFATAEYLSGEIDDLIATATAKLPDGIHFVRRIARDEKTILIYSETPPYPPRYFVFVSESGYLIEVPTSTARIRDYPLQTPERVTYFSTDGLEIPAYLTRPGGPDERPAPTVLMPHGGPKARDWITYNDWAQFLASRGYVVLQPNFRGSTGYGTIFDSRGNGEWGEAMQRDLDDGARWLIENGIADPDRICIVGASYGGYAALMGSIKGADYLQCAIAVAPVTSLTDFARSFQKSPFADHMRSEVIGTQTRQQRRANSPVDRGHKVEIPVLLIHGTSDIRVPVSHSRKMVKSLQRAKASYEYLELPGESHFLGNAGHRLEVLRRMEAFLGQHIPPPASDLAIAPE